MVESLFHYLLQVEVHVEFGNSNQEFGFLNVQNGPVIWESIFPYGIVWDIYFEKEGF